MAQTKPITRDLFVFDTPSGLGGTFTVAPLADLPGDRVRVRVCYGCFRGGGDVWESWPDWDGYEFETDRTQLTNHRPIGRR